SFLPPVAAHGYLHSFPTRRSSDLAENQSSSPYRPDQKCRRHARSSAPEVVACAPWPSAQELHLGAAVHSPVTAREIEAARRADRDRKSTRLNSSHVKISYAVFCLK